MSNILGVHETSPHMRRSISMPVKPQHLEPETLKRSAEKETVFATTDEELSSDGEDNSDTPNYLHQSQRSVTTITTTPAPAPSALTTNDDNTQIDNDEESTEAEISTATKNSQRGLYTAAKPFRSIRDFFSPIFTLFRKTTTWSSTLPPTTDTNSSTDSQCEFNGSSSKHLQKETSSSLNFSSCMERQISDMSSSANEEQHRNGHLTTTDFDSDELLPSTLAKTQQNGSERVTFTLT